MAIHSKIFIQISNFNQHNISYQHICMTKLICLPIQNQQSVFQKPLKKNSKFLYKAVKITKISNNLQYISFIRLHAKTVVY